MEKDAVGSFAKVSSCVTVGLKLRLLLEGPHSNIIKMCKSSHSVNPLLESKDKHINKDREGCSKEWSRSNIIQMCKLSPPYSQRQTQT